MTPRYNECMSTVPARKNRRWIWFFVVVFAMAVVATVVLIVFNLQQQLKPEQLAAARAMWKEKGPANYRMTYTQKLNQEPEDHYVVKVRGGTVVESFFNGSAEPPERWPYRSMEALFDFVEKFMRDDAQPSRPKVFVRAIFDDKKTGALRWYVRSVMGERHRVEITIERFAID